MCSIPFHPQKHPEISSQGQRVVQRSEGEALAEELKMSFFEARRLASVALAKLEGGLGSQSRWVERLNTR